LKRDIIEFKLFDYSMVFDNEPLGIVELAVRDIIVVPYIDNWFALYDYKRRSKKGVGQLHLRIGIGDDDRERLMNSFGGTMIRNIIGPPHTNFYVSKDGVEKKKVKERDARFNAGKGLSMTVRIVGAKGLKKGHVDPYVVIEIRDKKTVHKLKTKVIKKATEPVWNEEFSLAGEPVEPHDTLQFVMYNSDRLGSSVLGTCELYVQDIIDQVVINQKLPLLDSRMQEDKSRGKLHIMAVHGNESQLPPIKAESAADARSRSGTLPTKKKKLSPRGGIKSSDDIGLEKAKLSPRKGKVDLSPRKGKGDLSPRKGEKEEKGDQKKKKKAAKKLADEKEESSDEDKPKTKKKGEKGKAK